MLYKAAERIAVSISKCLLLQNTGSTITFVGISTPLTWAATPAPAAAAFAVASEATNAVQAAPDLTAAAPTVVAGLQPKQDAATADLPGLSTNPQTPCLRDEDAPKRCELGLMSLKPLLQLQQEWAGLSCGCLVAPAPDTELLWLYSCMYAQHMHTEPVLLIFETNNHLCLKTHTGDQQRGQWRPSIQSSWCYAATDLAACTHTWCAQVSSMVLGSQTTSCICCGKLPGRASSHCRCMGLATTGFPRCM